MIYSRTIIISSITTALLLPLGAECHRTTVLHCPTRLLVSFDLLNPSQLLKHNPQFLKFIHLWEDSPRQENHFVNEEIYKGNVAQIEVLVAILLIEG